MFVSAIIAAAGSGTRLGSSTPKQMLDIGGRPMLAHSMRTFLGHPRVSQVILVMPPGSSAPALTGINAEGLGSVTMAVGGARRQDSVANAFDLVGRSADVVLIHDAARPFVSAGLIDR